jgi:threonine synthase
MDRLHCPFCEKEYPLDLFNPFCPECGEPMLISWPRRPGIFSPGGGLSLETFRDFLPLDRIDRKLSLGEGNTPLVPLHRIRKKFGLPAVFAKNETMNPTQSFKDRGTAVVVQKAVSLGIRRIGTVSTGNMASSTAAYGAKAGLETFVFLKEDTTIEKVRSAGIHGAVLVKVKGDYGALFRESYGIGRRHKIYFANSIDPLRVEGYKVTSYEIFRQLGDRAPRTVFCPTSSGGHLIGLMRGFYDLREEGHLTEMPVFVGVQASGCSPLVRAFEQNRARFRRAPRARTIAHAISNPAPPAGNLALKWIRETGGRLVAVTDREILRAQKDLAELEGIYADPASATTLAALIKLSRHQGARFRGDCVLVITGSGLKSMGTLKHQKVTIHHASVENLENKLFDFSA